MTHALYQQAILAHARAATGKGRLPDPDGSATVDNPLCGDRVTIDVKMDGDCVSAVGHQVRGCLLCEAAASIIGARAVGAKPDQLVTARRAVDALLAGRPTEHDGAWPDIADFTPVRAFKSRHDCVRLPFEALEKALDATGAVTG